MAFTRAAAAAAAAAAAMSAVAATLPSRPIVWLSPDELSGGAAGSTLLEWPNAGTLGAAANAVLDDSSCFPKQGNCSSAPTVSVVEGGFHVATFSSHGRKGLGTNLIVPPANFTDGQSCSVFVVAAPKDERILAARNSNWLLGSWYDGDAAATFVDRAYTDASEGDGGWLAQGRTPADGGWGIWGLVVGDPATGAGAGEGAASPSCAWRGATLIGCGTGYGPGVLRLGGGGAPDNSPFAAEFGNGDIAEVVVYDRALSNAEVFALAGEWAAKYAGLLVRG
jgi:hypothetical protein